MESGQNLVRTLGDVTIHGKLVPVKIDIVDAFEIPLEVDATEDLQEHRVDTLEPPGRFFTRCELSTLLHGYE